MSKDKTTNRYIFPEWLANPMSKIDLRTQYEASMMSMSLILIGLILTALYYIIYGSQKVWMKIFIGINAFAGLIFLASFLITTFQQYRSYMDTIDFQKKLKGGNN